MLVSSRVDKEKKGKRYAGLGHCHEMRDAVSASLVPLANRSLE
jgi:hypothetical protein